MRSRQRGFSIIELMVVLAVTGIVLFFGAPSFNSTLKNGKLTGGVNELIAAMHLSRSEASKRSLPVVMCTSTTALSAGAEGCTANTSWESGWLIFGDANDNGQFDNDEEVIQRRGPQHATLNVIASDNDISTSITYLQNGFARLPLNTTTGRFIVYCNDDGEDRYSRVLAVSNSGRPQIVDRNNTTGAPSCADSE